MHKPLYLGIDLGTSYFKLCLFDDSLTLRGLGRVSAPISSEMPSQSEISPPAFLDAVASALRLAIRQAGAQGRPISAVSWSSQANSFVALDRNMNPLTKIVLWNDRRAPPHEKVRKIGNLPNFQRITGCGAPPSQYSAISKINFLKTASARLWSKTAAIATLPDYLSFLLTGKRKIDAATAALMALLDQRELVWWRDALEILQLAPELLPTPVRTGTLIGAVTAEGAALMNAPELKGARLFAGTLDHVAAAIGAGVGEGASISESTGTVLAAVRLFNKISDVPSVTSIPGRSAGEYFLLAYDNNGAGVLEWYRNNYATDTTFTQLDSLAAQIPSHCGGLRMLDSPHLRPDLSGFSGASRDMTHGHYARAIMTSVTSRLGTILERLGAQPSEKIVATGGGARSPFWLQMKRDMLRIDIHPANCAEPACKGAAIIAATPDAIPQPAKSATNDMCP